MKVQTLEMYKIKNNSLTNVKTLTNTDLKFYDYYYSSETADTNFNFRLFADKTRNRFKHYKTFIPISKNTFLLGNPDQLILYSQSDSAGIPLEIKTPYQYDKLKIKYSSEFLFISDENNFTHLIKDTTLLFSSKTKFILNDSLYGGVYNLKTNTWILPKGHGELLEIGDHIIASHYCYNSEFSYHKFIHKIYNKAGQPIVTLDDDPFYKVIETEEIFNKYLKSDRFIKLNDFNCLFYHGPDYYFRVSNNWYKYNTDIRSFIYQNSIPHPVKIIHRETSDWLVHNFSIYKLPVDFRFYRPYYHELRRFQEDKQISPYSVCYGAISDKDLCIVIYNEPKPHTIDDLNRIQETNCHLINNTGIWSHKKNDWVVKPEAYSGAFVSGKPVLKYLDYEEDNEGNLSNQKAIYRLYDNEGNILSEFHDSTANTIKKDYLNIIHGIDFDSCIKSISIHDIPRTESSINYFLKNEHSNQEIYNHFLVSYQNKYTVIQRDEVANYQITSKLADWVSIYEPDIYILDDSIHLGPLNQRSRSFPIQNLKISFCYPISSSNREKILQLYFEESKKIFDLGLYNIGRNSMRYISCEVKPYCNNQAPKIHISKDTIVTEHPGSLIDTTYNNTTSKMMEIKLLSELWIKKENKWTLELTDGVIKPLPFGYFIQSPQQYLLASKDSIQHPNRIVNKTLQPVDSFQNLNLFNAETVKEHTILTYIVNHKPYKMLVSPVGKILMTDCNSIDLTTIEDEAHFNSSYFTGSKDSGTDESKQFIHHIKEE
jgi:hypothetical protein